MRFNLVQASQKTFYESSSNFFSFAVFMMVCNKSLLNSCPSGRKRKSSRVYFGGKHFSLNYLFEGREPGFDGEGKKKNKKISDENCVRKVYESSV